MKIKGVLNLSYDKDDYVMFYNGRNVNLTEILNNMLFDDVMIRIKNKYDGKELFYAEGKLIKNKISFAHYLYHVDKKNLDEVLWNNIGKRLIIEVRNITKD